MSKPETPEPGTPCNSVIESILGRYSVSPKRVAGPGPDAAQILTLVSAAAAAPDHGRFRPWRFLEFPAHTRESLADVFEEALLERLPNANSEARERAREKAGRAPVLLGLILTLNPNSDVPHINDQIASGGAALQNVLLAANAMGFGARALSGQSVRTQCFRRALDLSEHEVFLCFITIGTATTPPKPRERPRPEILLGQWNGA
jgi:nitroreductase